MKEKKVIFAVGLPGSGKSTYMKNSYSNTANYRYFEEYATTNGSRIFAESSDYNPVIKTIKDGIVPVITNIHFCEKERRYDAENSLRKAFPNIKIVWEFFENNPELCKENVLARREKEQKEDKGEMATMDKYAPNYSIPNDVTPIKVYSGN